MENMSYSENALELKGVTKHYKEFDLENINLILPAGCIMGLIGENGAGKSTVIKLILDLIHRDEGTIKIMGKDNITEVQDIKEQIGVVMDESCFPEVANKKNINYIMGSIYKNWDEKKFGGLCQRFSLPEKKAIKDYSRGMKMKLAIAVALSHNAKLLILDEATSGLDPVIRNEILDVFLDFIQSEENSILISSHITSDLEKICDYITFIHKGRILISDSKDALIEEHGVLKCSEEDLKTLNNVAMIGLRKGKFGAEALVKRESIRGNYIVDKASLEDIMLFYIKEKRQEVWK